MDKLTFEKLTSSPFDISSQDAGQLEGLLNSFPYCQIAYLLIAKESHDKNSMLYPQKLRKASTYSLNRKVLHHLIHKKSTTTVPEKKNDALIAVVSYQKEVSLPIQSAPTAFNQQPLDHDNSTLLNELEENMRLLKEQRHLYEVAAQNQGNNHRGEIQQKESSPKPLFIPPSEENLQLTFMTSAPLVIEETKLGDELSSEQKLAGSELEMLLSYLCPPLPKKVQTHAIDKFIKNEPKITKASKLIPHTGNADLSRPSTELKVELTTENYALILVKQNKIDKALEVYRKLVLKYPDKSAYFAAKIHELENR